MDEIGDVLRELLHLGDDGVLDSAERTLQILWPPIDVGLAVAQQVEGEDLRAGRLKRKTKVNFRV